MFNGFTPETSQFLWGLKFNNEKPWFEAHREEYQRFLLEPFTALARDTFSLMDRRWPGMGFSLHISRIYRDARRLHGRGPYKDHLWFSIKNWDGLLCGPMFWFEVGATDFSYGMGFYSASPRQMEGFRKSVLANPARLEQIASAVNSQNTFVLSGEEYKRPKGDLGPLLNPWYNRKYLGLEHEEDFSEALFQPGLPERLAGELGSLMPVYSYFMEVCTPEEQ